MDDADGFVILSFDSETEARPSVRPAGQDMTSRQLQNSKSRDSEESTLSALRARAQEAKEAEESQWVAEAAVVLAIKGRAHARTRRGADRGIGRISYDTLLHLTAQGQRFVQHHALLKELCTKRDELKPKLEELEETVARIRTETEGNLNAAAASASNTLERLRLTGFEFGEGELELEAWVWCAEASRFLGQDKGIGTLEECVHLIESAPKGCCEGSKESFPHHVSPGLVKRLRTAFDEYQSWCERTRDSSYSQRPSTQVILRARDESEALFLSGSEVSTLRARCARAEKLETEIQKIIGRLTSLPKSSDGSLLWTLIESDLSSLKYEQRSVSIEAEKLYLDLGELGASFTSLEWALKAHTISVHKVFNSTRCRSWLSNAPSSVTAKLSGHHGYIETINGIVDYGRKHLEKYVADCENWLGKYNDLLLDEDANRVKEREVKGSAFMHFEKLLKQGMQQQLRLQELEKLTEDMESLQKWKRVAVRLLLLGLCDSTTKESGDEVDDDTSESADSVTVEILEKCMSKGERIISRLPSALTRREVEYRYDESCDTVSRVYEVAKRNPTDLIVLIEKRIARIEAFMGSVREIIVKNRFSNRRANVVAESQKEKLPNTDFSVLHAILGEQRAIFGSGSTDGLGSGIYETLGFIEDTLKWEREAVAIQKDAVNLIEASENCSGALQKLRELLSSAPHLRIDVTRTYFISKLHCLEHVLEASLLLSAGRSSCSIETLMEKLDVLEKDVALFGDNSTKKRSASKGSSSDKFSRESDVTLLKLLQWHIDKIQSDVKMVNSWSKTAASLLRRDHELDTVVSLLSSLDADVESGSSSDEYSFNALAAAVPLRSRKILEDYLEVASNWMENAETAIRTVYSKAVSNLLSEVASKPLCHLTDAKPLTKQLIGKQDDEVLRQKARRESRQRRVQFSSASETSIVDMTERQQLAFLLRSTSHNDPDFAESSASGEHSSTALSQDLANRCYFCQHFKIQLSEGHGFDRCGPVVGPFSARRERDEQRPLRWAHARCLAFSSEVLFRSAIPKLPSLSMQDFAEADNVSAALSRATQVKCSSCKRTGGTVGCFGQRCHRTFHFGCLHEAGCQYAYSKAALRTDQMIGPLFFALCPRHSLQTKDPELLRPSSGVPVEISSVWDQLTPNVQNQLRELVYVVEETYPLVQDDEGSSTDGHSGSLGKRKRIKDEIEVKWLGWPDSDNTYESINNFLGSGDPS